MTNRPKDPRGGHIRLYNDMYDSMAFRALSWLEQGLWLAMRRKLLGSNNGNIEATLGGSGGVRHQGISSPASLAKALRSLQAVGLIAKTRQGLLSQGRRTCSLYRFTDEAVLENQKLSIPRMPATNEWKAFTNLKDAQRAIAAVHLASKTGRKRSSENATSIQLVKGTGTTPEPVSTNVDTRSESGPVASVRNLKVVKTG